MRCRKRRLFCTGRIIMAINKFMRFALKALSYPDLDVQKTYQIQRTIQNLKPSSLLPQSKGCRNHMVWAEDREILTRIYTPRENLQKHTLLFFHGGGWVTENVNTYHKVCFSLANVTKSKVISVEYRLAPEHPFPQGLEDCYAVTRTLFTQPDIFGIDPAKITLVGDSAGGNLAAAVSLRARDEGEFHIPAQILIYPATYHDHSEKSPFASVSENGSGYLLTAKRICEYINLYMRDEQDLVNPYFAPLLAKDFSDQPDTLLITAEFDPLRDEGEAYAKKLRDAGNYVSAYRMRDALHGFMSLGARYVHVRRAYELINLFINRGEENEPSN